MPPSTSLLPPHILLILAHLPPTHAHTTNTTLIHGWVPDPSTRGTFSLLWTSLVTILLCTWSTLHLHVTRPHSYWRRLRHKLLYTLLLTIAPEVGLALAVGNLFRARRLLRELGAEFTTGEQAWGLAHMLFACQDGFWKRGCGEGGLEVCGGAELVAGVKSGVFAAVPAVSRAELQSRSRSDGAVRTIAVVQILWFVVQLLVRVGEGWQATALEIMTAAYVVCSVLTYGFSWGAPQNVEFPIVVEVEGGREGVGREESGGKGEREGEGARWGGEGCKEETSQRETCSEVSREDEGRETKVMPVVREQERWGWLVALPMGSTFGAIHCLAWHAPFPTRVERDIWRVCSGIMTGLPLFITPEIVGWRFLHLGRYLNMFERGSEAFLGALMFYTLARLLVIILAVISVRALPADAYQTANWSQYIPHFGV